MMTRESYLFGTGIKALVKEGVDFWTTNRFRNYLRGISSIPEFAGEYIPQQQHFDALFHILFLKKCILHEYLKGYSAAVENTKGFEGKRLNGENYRDKGLQNIINIIRDDYLRSDFKVITTSFLRSYRSTVLRQLNISSSNDTSKLIAQYGSSCTASSQDEQPGCLWSIGGYTNTDNSYSSVSYEGTGTRRTPMHFFKNATVDGNKHKFTMSLVYTAKMQGVTKKFYKGITTPNNYTALSVPENGTFKCMLDIPFSGYTISFFNANNVQINSQLINRLKVTCVGNGYLTAVNALDRAGNTGQYFFNTGEILGGINSPSIEKIGGERTVSIDKQTAIALGVSIDCSYAKIQKVNYTYRHSFIGSGNNGLVSHTHTLKHAPTKNEYFKGDLYFWNTKKTYVGYGGSHTYYEYPSDWRFSIQEFKSDRVSPTTTQQLGWHGFDTRTFRRQYGGSLGRGNLKTKDWGSAPEEQMVRRTHFEYTWVVSNTMFKSKAMTINYDIDTNLNGPKTTYNINNAILELTINDHVTDICEGLI